MFGENFNVMTVVDVLLIVYGAYSLVTTMKMKRDGEISQWLVSANELPRVRDPEGFCRDMYLPTFVFAIGCMGFGLFSMLNEYLFGSMFVVEIIIIAAFVACIIYFVTNLRKAKKNYINVF